MSVSEGLDASPPDGEVRAGLYRGLVTRVDPSNQLRVGVAVPAINGTNEIGWALLSMWVYSGVPVKGTPVWVAFEHGETDKPVVLGRWT